MKLIFAAVLLACASQSAQALKPASKKELKELNEIFVTINNISDLIAENRASYDTASPEKKADLNQKYMGLKEKREAPCRRALWLTIKAYDLMPFEGDKPILPSGVSSFRSPEIGKTITWVPVFEEKTPYNLQNAVGKISFRNVDIINAAGNTASDGISRVFPEAFTSPVALATLIYHEGIHFKQFTSPPPDRMTSAEREVAAYSAQREVWRKNLLGMTPDELETEDDYLKDNLAIYKAKAAVQRAEVKKANGLPLDEHSIVSHNDDEIKKLIAQARNQVKIANADHDERLRSRLVNIAKRSCADPGGVSQTELDSLPKPYDTSSMGLRTGELGGSCDIVYLMLVRGTNAEALRKASTPPPVQVPAQPIQPSPYVAPIIAQTPFSTVLPGLRDHAVNACNSSGEVPIDSNLTNPNNPLTFWKEMDDKTADKLAAGLGNCEGRLFRELIRVIRDGYGNRISSSWIKEMVEEYRPRPNPSSGNTPPRQRTDDPPLNRNCFIDKYGTEACPAGW